MSVLILLKAETPKTPISPAFELKDSARSSDDSSTDRSSDTNTDTDRGVDSDRKKPPASVSFQPIKEEERQQTPEPKRKESVEKTPAEIAAIINEATEKKEDDNKRINIEQKEENNVIVKGMAPEYSEDESEPPTPRAQKVVTASDTDHGSGEGGDDTLKALTDEYAKVLETTNKGRFT